MSDEVARAVGAGDGTIAIAGKECAIRPLGLRELCEVERECLRSFRKQYMETYADGLELLPGSDEDRKQQIAQKLDEVCRWDISDLPVKHAYLADSVTVTDKLKEWMRSNFNTITDETNDNQYKLLTAFSLDQGLLTADKYKELTDQEINKTQIDYVGWWSTATVDGMLTFIWKAFSRYGLTRKQIEDDLGANVTRMAELSRQIERLSVPAVGNG
jgi:hypothetical protein